MTKLATLGTVGLVNGVEFTVTKISKNQRTATAKNAAGEQLTFRLRISGEYVRVNEHYARGTKFAFDNAAAQVAA